jgi:Zn-dependent peptidase ImmA (M78 family)/transcriptional regulator with XRE-family HTH domain
MTDHPTSYGAIVEEWRDEHGFDRDELAGMLGWSIDDVVELEEGDKTPSFDDLRKLSSVLGLELELYDPDLDDQPEKRPEVSTLLKSESKNIDQSAFPPIFEATEIAHQLVEVRRWRDEPNRFEQVRSLFQGYRPSDSGKKDWEQGEDLARTVRETLELGNDPVESVYRLALDLDVAIIDVRLPKANFTAMALADEYHGPSIILNKAAKGGRPLPRRFAVAHELCHVLFDNRDLTPMRKFDREVGYFEAQHKSSTERRADAFAIYLLCPPDAFVDFWDFTARPGRSYESRIRQMMTHFGVGLEATLGHLKSTNLLDDDAIRNLGDVPTDPPRRAFDDRYWPDLDLAERRSLRVVSLPRRGLLLAESIQAYREHAIGRSKLLELLDVDADEFDEHVDTWTELTTEHPVA